MHITTSQQAPLDLGFGDYSCSWGVHFCGLYETEEERDEIVMGFLHCGAQVGDLQLYCPTERSEADFRQHYTCLYPQEEAFLDDAAYFELLSAFSGATIMDVLRTHPYSISGGVITENPYYQDPDYWLARNAPQFLPPGRA